LCFRRDSGDYDSYQPTSQSSVIDFNGRTAYVRAALNAAVPIVPVVSIGAQETHSSSPEAPGSRSCSGSIFNGSNSGHQCGVPIRADRDGST